jgi:hypothetical protein
MKQFHDQQAYEEREMRLVEEIVRCTKQALIEAGFSGDKLQAVTERITFSVAEAVDGATHMDLGDDHLVPILAFAEGRMRDRLLLSEGGGGSSLHEYVFGISRESFKNKCA